MGPPVENGRQVLETLWLDSLSLVLLSLAPLSLYRFRCTIVHSFQRANPAMLKKIIYVVSVIHRV